MQVTTKKLTKRTVNIEVEYYSRGLTYNDKVNLKRRIETITNDDLSEVAVLSIKQKRMEKK